MASNEGGQVLLMSGDAAVEKKLFILKTPRCRSLYGMNVLTSATRSRWAPGLLIHAQAAYNSQDRNQLLPGSVASQLPLFGLYRPALARNKMSEMSRLHFFCMPSSWLSDGWERFGFGLQLERVCGHTMCSAQKVIHARLGADAVCKVLAPSNGSCRIQSGECVVRSRSNREVA